MQANPCQDTKVREALLTLQHQTLPSVEHHTAKVSSLLLADDTVEKFCSCLSNIVIMLLTVVEGVPPLCTAMITSFIEHAYVHRRGLASSTCGRYCKGN